MIHLLIWKIGCAKFGRNYTATFKSHNLHGAFTRFKKTVRDRIHCLLNTYPASAAIITSRIIGYKNPYRFDDKAYSHHKLARLSLEKMERFVTDWYAVRVEHVADRHANIHDLVRILQDPQQMATRELARGRIEALAHWMHVKAGLHHHFFFPNRAAAIRRNTRYASVPSKIQISSANKPITIG